jgi:IgA Peptidase M64
MNLRGYRPGLLLSGWKCWLPLLLAGAAVRAEAQASLAVLFTNGPASNRVNIVLFSEGYKTNQLATFLTNAANAASNLLTAPPYNEYSNYFNAYAVSVASTNSGSNHTPYKTASTNKTYFSSSYNSATNLPQLITIPPNDRDANYADGQGKVQALLTNLTLYAATNLAVATNVLPWLTPSNRFVVLVVNDTTYGGSGQPPNATNPLPIAITSLGSTNGVPAAKIIVHESGHTLAGLADEYTTPDTAITPVERPNATAMTNFGQIPWNAWIDTNLVALPTPDTGNNALLVGLFEGAEYNATGWYRPMETCIMNDFSAPATVFCNVCAEAIVKAINQKVRTLDAYAPATNNNHVTLATTNAALFSITPLRPSTHSLDLQWFTNGVAVAGATNASFTLLPASLTNGPCTVQAQVHDSTLPAHALTLYNSGPLVLNDPNHVLSNSVSWTVSIGLTNLRLTSPRALAGGLFAVTITGTAPYGFVIQASTNLANWVPVATNTLTGGAFDYTNNAGVSPRFFRTVYAP